MSIIKQFSLVFAALALCAGACSSPRSRIALRKVHLVAHQVYYVPADQFKTIKFSPPPAPDARGQEADLAAILSWQNKRTGADCEKARLTAKADVDFFWGRNNPFPGDDQPAAFREFIGRLSLDLEEAVTNMKKRWKRLRPFRAYPGQAEPCIKRSGGFSYPSGHASFSRVFANVLSDIIPERREEFLARADEIAMDRVIGGVHFPTDIAAGRTFGDLYHQELLKSETYRGDIGKMRELLKK